MATIKTKRNLVFVYGPEPGHDLFVITVFGPGGGGANLLWRLQPISQWQAAVDWAVGQADMLASPLRVAAIGMSGLMRFYGEAIDQGLATLSGDEGAAVRQVVVTTYAEILRDSPDYGKRANAYDVMVKLGVFPCAGAGGGGCRCEPPHWRL